MPSTFYLNNNERKSNGGSVLGFMRKTFLPINHKPDPEHSAYVSRQNQHHSRRHRRRQHSHLKQNRTIQFKEQHQHRNFWLKIEVTSKDQWLFYLWFDSVMEDLGPINWLFLRLHSRLRMDQKSEHPTKLGTVSPKSNTESRKLFLCLTVLWVSRH